MTTFDTMQKLGNKNNAAPDAVFREIIMEKQCSHYTLHAPRDHYCQVLTKAYLAKLHHLEKQADQQKAA
jgi:putative NIF3 family GTP cyclohydrolase 1 type 2